MGKSPDAFRTISEVADWLEIQAHVLRFWESKFTQVKPVKRAGGRRYYRPQDMLLLGGIKKLLHDDGMTIKGAQKLLREKGVKHVAGLSRPLEGDTGKPVIDTSATQIPETSQAAAPPPEPEPDYLPEDDAPLSPEDYLPEADAPLMPEDDLPEMTLVDDADKTADDAPAPSVSPGLGDLFSHAQDTLVSGATDGSDEDIPAPSQDTIPAFIQRVAEHAVEDADDEPEEAAPEASAPMPDKTEADSDAGSEFTDTEQDEDAESTVPDLGEAAQTFLVALSAAEAIQPGKRSEAAALMAELEALRARSAQSDTA